MPRRQRVALTALACIVFVAAAVGIGLAPRTRARATPPATIVVHAGRPVGGVRTLVYRQGATIDITVRSDTATVVRFRDLQREAPRGGSVRLRAPASATGEFALETDSQKLADVWVTP